MALYVQCEGIASIEAFPTDGAGQLVVTDVEMEHVPLQGRTETKRFTTELTGQFVGSISENNTLQRLQGQLKPNVLPQN